MASTMIPRGPKHASPFKRKNRKRPSKPATQTPTDVFSVADTAPMTDMPLPKLEDAAVPDSVAAFDDDLNLWLEYTRFYDLNYRNRMLYRFRQLKALDEQRTIILSEIQSASGGMINPLEAQGTGSLNALAPHSLSTTLSVVSETTSPAPQSFQNTSHTGSSSEFRKGSEFEHKLSARDVLTLNTGVERMDDDAEPITGPNEATSPHRDDRDESSMVAALETVRLGNGKAEIAAAGAKVPRYAPPKPKIHLSPQLHDPNTFQGELLS